MHGNTVPAWRCDFIAAKVALPKMKWWRWLPLKMIRSKCNAPTVRKMLFPLGQSSALCACMDVGEKRKLKVAAGDKLLLQANWQKQFINGELVEVKAIQGGRTRAGRWPDDP